MLTGIRCAPQPVAIGRILLGLGLLLIAIEGAAILAVLQSGRILTPVVSTWYTAEDLPFAFWLAVTMVACLGVITGTLIRTSLLVYAIGEIVMMLVDQEIWSNHRFLAVLVCLAFVAAQSDRALSFGAASRRERCATVPWWPQMIALSAVSSCYLFAGLSKINPAFLGGAELSELRWIEIPDEVMTPFAALVIATEVGIGVGLWFKPARILAVVAGLGLHLSIIALLDGTLVLTAFALLCVSVYPLALTRQQLK